MYDRKGQPTIIHFIFSVSKQINSVELRFVQLV